MKEIIVDISPEGEIKIETRGFKGKSCLKESQFLRTCWARKPNNC
jgi:hypothetical protein